VVALALVSTATTVAIAFNLATVVSSIFIDRVEIDRILPNLFFVAIAGVVKASTIWLQEMAGARAAGLVISDLRSKLFAAVQRLGDAWLAQRSIAQINVLATSGLGALEPYFAKYLPQVIFTGVVTPIFLAIIWSQDLASGITVLLTIPLIPLFMILIGWATRSVQQKQLDSLVALSQHFLEVLRGLTTLRVFGRAQAQVKTIETVSDDYRVRTMKVLRISFLSGFALELAASLSVALIAVSIGLRLVDGQISLFTGLFILILAPEAYLPLRQVGVQFHAASEGVAASKDVLDILDESVAAEPVAPNAAKTQLTRFRQKSLNVIIGPSGVGKSTAMRQLVDLPNSVWMPQATGLFNGSVAENIHGGVQSIDEVALAKACELAALDDLDLLASVGESASQISGGQAQRVALARTFYAAITKDTEYLLLDEPISALDHERSEKVIGSLQAFANQGMTVIAITHQQALISAASQIVEVQGV